MQEGFPEPVAALQRGAGFVQPPQFVDPFGAERVHYLQGVRFHHRIGRLEEGQCVVRRALRRRALQFLGHPIGRVDERRGRVGGGVGTRQSRSVGTVDNVLALALEAWRCRRHHLSPHDLHGSQMAHSRDRDSRSLHAWCCRKTSERLSFPRFLPRLIRFMRRGAWLEETALSPNANRATKHDFHLSRCDDDTLSGFHGNSSMVTSC